MSSFLPPAFLASDKAKIKGPVMHACSNFNAIFNQRQALLNDGNDKNVCMAIVTSACESCMPILPYTMVICIVTCVLYTVSPVIPIRHTEFQKAAHQRRSRHYYTHGMPKSAQHFLA
jgi:hypothetical protein